MEVAIITIERKVCGTCLHWDGARECENAAMVVCIKGSEGVCEVMRGRRAGILDTLKTGEDGENCQDWGKWDCRNKAHAGL